jgi:hypothetical protein
VNGVENEPGKAHVRQIDAKLIFGMRTVYSRGARLFRPCDAMKVAVKRRGNDGPARKLRATAVIGCLGVAVLTAAVLSSTRHSEGELEGPSSTSYWGAGAPAWWSDFPVVTRGASELAVPADGGHVLVRNKAKAAAEQRLRAKTPAEHSMGVTTPVERARVERALLAEKWLGGKRPSNSGHWAWVPSLKGKPSPSPAQHHSQQLVEQEQQRRHVPTAAIPYRIGSYTLHPPATDPHDEGMPFRNGKYTHQHWWDQDGERRIWDTGTFSSSADASVARNGRLFGYGIICCR